MGRWKDATALLGAALLLLPAACDQGRQTEETGAPPAEAPAPAGEPSAGEPAATRLLNPNEATPEELAAVPGLNPQAVDALVKGRPYRDMLAVDRALANTLSEAEREAVYDRLWLPVDVNTAPYEMLLRVPGIGVRSAKRIISARRTGPLNFEGLKKLGVVLKRAQYFILCSGRAVPGLKMSHDSILRGLLSDRSMRLMDEDSGEQLSLFDDSLVTREDVLKCLTGQI